MIPRLIITPGEPAGIGPEQVVQLAQKSWPAELVVCADPQLLEQCAERLSLPIELNPLQPDAPAHQHQPGQLSLLPVSLKKSVTPGQLDPVNVPYCLDMLETATQFVLNQTEQPIALVTGPIHKGVISEAGLRFYGHTEFLAQQCNDCQTVMMLANDKMRIALITTHLPLRAVPDAVTAELVTSVVTTAHEDLQRWFAIENPRISVCGLNPHAGENGQLGHEEVEIIRPALDALRESGMNIKGPVSADTAFTEKHIAEADVVIAMYHDQGLSVIKHAGFSQTVNITLGLPFIRTSVDHGTALDLAGTGNSDLGSFTRAINTAIALAKPARS